MTDIMAYPRKYLYEQPWLPGSTEASKSMGVSHAEPGEARWAMVSLEPTSRPNLPYPVGEKTLALVRAVSFEGNQFTWDNVYVTSVYKRPNPFGQKGNKKFTIARRKEAYLRMVEELNAALGTPEDVHEREYLRPARILAFDTAVADLLAPNFEGISEDHGTFFYNPDIHAYVIPVPNLQYTWQNPVRREWAHRDLVRLFTLPDPIPPKYELVTGFAPGIEKGDWVYYDVETTGVEYFVDKITLLCYAVNGDEGVYIIKDPAADVLEDFMNQLNEKAAVVVGHNLSFDLGMMITSTGILPKFPVLDTMVMAFLLGHEKKALKHLTSVLTDRPGSRAYGGFTSLGYVAEDVLSTRDILTVLQPQVEKIFAHSFMERLVVKFAIMRYQGVMVRHDLMAELEAHYAEMIAEKVDELHSYRLGASTNFNAPAQVGNFLISNGVQLTEKTESGQFSTSEAALLKIENPVAKAILDYRALTKDYGWLTSYRKFSSASPWGMLHPRMNLTQARTGRTSCADPNLQQVPRLGDVKRVFISRFPGGFIGLVDLAQAELRGAALISEDPEFIEALNSEDVHRAMAAKAFRKPEAEITPTERKRSKGVTFGKLYGGSNAGLAKRMGMREEEVASVERALFQAFPMLAQTLEDLAEIGISAGMITTPFGRVRDLREIIALEGEGSAGRKAKNTPIQSMASDVMLVITDAAQDYLDAHNARSHVIFGVHDSGLYDIHPDEVQLVADAVSHGFRALNATPLAEFPAFKVIAFSGELIIAPSWAEVEDTNPAYKDPDYIYACSNATPGPVLRTISHYRDISHVQVDRELAPILEDIRHEAADEEEETTDENTTVPEPISNTQ